MNRKPSTSAFATVLGASLALAFSLTSCESVKTPPEQAHADHDHSTHERLPQSPRPVAANRGAMVKPYPLDVCLVSDEDLDSMGGPITRIHQGQEIKFCCKACVKDFDKSPAKYLAKLQ